MAAPFLTAQLGASARIIIQVAWGADLTAASTSWVWTDITADVRIKDQINIKIGRGDEAAFSQPASVTLVLENKTGAYSLGGQSPNWPNVVKNTPVRVMIDHDGDGLYTALFVGYADSWVPTWDPSAKVATVHLTASGILRRLQQHSSPVLSSLRRRLATETNVVAYWPLEEGKLATSGKSALTGQADMQPIGIVDWAEDSQSFASTVQMPVLKLGGLIGAVPYYTFTPTTGWQARALLSFPENGTGMVNDGIICRLQINHPSLATVDILYGTGGSLKTVGYSYNSLGAYVQVFTNTTAFAVDGKKIRLYFEVKQNGTGIDWKTGIQTPGAGGSFASGTLAASTLGYCTSISFGTHANMTGLAVGHVTVQNVITSIFSDAKELDAFEGEVSFVRFSRLAGENGIANSVSGDGTGFDQPTDLMGEQRPEPLMTLLQQVQEVDRGIIYDGRTNGGLTFISRRMTEAALPAMTINVAGGDLAGTLEPIDDDQALLNKAVVSRQDGATAVFEDKTGPLGTTRVGTYDSSLTIPVKTDAAAYLYAGWIVSLGTVGGYRYPQVALDLAARPALIPSLLALVPGQRIDLVGIGTVATQHPRRTVSLVVQGIEHTITPHTWTARLNCTPFEPWSIGKTVNTDGTVVAPATAEQTLRLDTAGSQLSAAAAANATSLSVATTSGPLWTTAAADLPFDIEVGGIVVTVTAISGTSSPQTFTVTGVTKALASGLDVQLAEPERVGL